MNPSIFQKAIFDRVSDRTKTQNLIIRARAGSGKTTTIVKCTELLPSSAQVIFLAFNKSIAEELKNRVPPNVDATTFNSFGWRACLKQKRAKLDEFKTDELVREACKGDSKKYRKIRSAVSQIIGLMKAWVFPLEFSIAELNQLIVKYGIEPPDVADLNELIYAVYKESVRQLSIMDFNDQVFVPVFHNYPLPQYDYVFVDEAQDLNPVQIQLVLRLNAQVIAVGDDKQAIYGFRGADPDALENLQVALKADVLPLSISYRCPKSVIKLAKNIVPDIESAETADEGIVRTMPVDKMKTMWRDGDYVICRTTAPLVTQCLKLIQDGRKAFVKGRDIGKNLLEILEKLPAGDLAAGLTQWASEQHAKLARFPNNEAKIALMQDKVETLIALIASTVSGTLEEVNIKVEKIFTDSGKGICFSTIHKAKGLEAERVFILRMDLLPHPAAKLPWQQKQEQNLKYVAITRSKSELYLEGVETEPAGKPAVKPAVKKAYKIIEVEVEEYRHGKS